MKDDLLPLRHILDAAEKVQRYASGKTSKELANDQQLYDSILMNLVVIGEEANRVSNQTKLKYPEVPWYEMIGMRNLISHDYFSVNPQIIWDTVQNSIPKLKQTLEKIL